MPRLDGKLYEYEKAALKPKREPKKRGRPPKVRPPAVYPDHDKEPILVEEKPIEQCETQAEGLSRIAKELGVKTVPVARNGRPLKASVAIVKGIRETIRRGMTIDKSCIMHGVSRSILDKWKKVNSDIMQLFEMEELEAEAELVDIVKAAAPKDWKAGNWLLERRHDWQQVSRTELTGRDGGPIQQTTLSKQLLASVGGKGDGYVTERKRKGPLPATATEHGTTNQVIDVSAKVVTQHDAKHDASPDVAK